MQTALTQVVLFCRAGFERECAGEMQELAANQGVYGYPQFEPASGYVLFICTEPGGAYKLIHSLPWQQPVFTRQWAACLPTLGAVPKQDRVGWLVQAMADFPQGGEVWVEAPDSEQGGQLQTLCRKLTPPLASALRKVGKLSEKRNLKQPRLYVAWLTEQQVVVGLAKPANAAPWPQGIMRLKFPAGAPSRSTLKLDEAWRFFLSAEEQQSWLQPGMTAVDLGAAPGGWTWQLAHQHFRVTAVDNGPMDEALMESGLVKHRQEDGFTYVPERPVDWMVCDIADKPSRSIDLMARWFEQGWCRFSVFNLKLPMQKRLAAYQQCREVFESRMQAAGLQVEMRWRQLYHDREEITAFVRLLD